jgi:hypothetical protein
MLAAMFSHDNDMEPDNVDEDGAYIIHDRNPLLFGYILRFLESRDDERSIENSSTEDNLSSTVHSIIKELSMESLETLHTEVDYYQIAGLQGEIQNEIGSRKEEEESRKEKEDSNQRLCQNLRMKTEEQDQNIRDLKRRLAEQRREYRDLEYETSENGCLVEFKEAKEGDRIILGDQEGVIQSISTTTGREATVEWTRPKTMMEKLKIALKVSCCLGACFVMYAISMLHARFFTKEDISFRERSSMVALIFFVSLLLLGRNYCFQLVEYTTHPNHKTSEDGCLIECKEAKEGDRIVLGDHEGVIKSISTTIGREATVEWTGPRKELNMTFIGPCLFAVICMISEVLIAGISPPEDRLFRERPSITMIIFVSFIGVIFVGVISCMQPMHDTTRPYNTWQ